jgi:rod shape-determining protein MreC
MASSSKTRLRILVVGLYLVAAMIFWARSKETRHLNVLDRVLLTITAPLQDAMLWFIESSCSLWQDYIWLVDVAEENQTLRSKVDELELALAHQVEVKAENQRLRKLVNMAARHSSQHLLAARIVGVGTSPATQVVRIDAGRNQGVRVGDAVLASAGLVGRVQEVVSGYADVQLVTDARAAVDVLIQRSRAKGIMRGQGLGEHCMLDRLVRTSDVVLDDKVVTSGIGGQYPTGLVVGTIFSVSSPPVGPYRKAEISPALNFDILEEVLVVLHRPCPQVESVEPGEDGGGLP